MQLGATENLLHFFFFLARHAIYVSIPSHIPEIFKSFKIE